MNVVVLAEQLGDLGGAQKHGLMLLPPLAGLHAVTVCYRAPAGFDPARLRDRFGLALDGVEFRHCHSDREVLRRARRADLFVNLTYASVVPNPAPLGLLMVYFPHPLADHPPARWRGRVGHRVEAARQWALGVVEDVDPDLRSASVGEYRRRHGAARAAARLPLFLLRKVAWAGYRDLRLGAAAVRSYTRVLANSRYTAGWVGRYYGRDPDLSYPPIDTAAFRPGAKAPEVLAVGRFDDGHNPKRFEVLVDAFRAAHDLGLLAGWTFHLCGGVGGPAGEAYLARLRARAAGYPVEFHPDLPFPKLVGRYATATLFWHAMGYGADAGRPWQCEHFGMTTAEAMAAGCVPMAVNAGGQPEAVGPAGYLWDTPDQLVGAVREFVGLPPAEAERMRRAARRQAETFGYRAFFDRTVATYRALGVPCRAVDELAPPAPPDPAED